MLDDDLNKRNGAAQNTYNQFNKLDDIPTAIIALDGDAPAGCGCFKQLDDETVEIKRIFVPMKHRRKGIAEKLIHELELWAAELHYRKAVLETGLRQPEAIRLYEKLGYIRIPNYGQYKDMKNSVCYLKRLTDK